MRKWFKDYRDVAAVIFILSFAATFVFIALGLRGVAFGSFAVSVISMIVCSQRRPGDPGDAYSNM